MESRKVSVYTRENRVILSVEGFDVSMFLDAPAAMRLMDALHAAAVSLGMVERVTGAAVSVISETLRQQMMTRCIHVMRCHEGKPSAQAAYAVVDSVLGLLP